LENKEWASYPRLFTFAWHELAERATGLLEVAMAAIAMGFGINDGRGL
jgi:hypothetical protein